MSQYSFSPPLVLPMACVYSQRISGMSGRWAARCLTRSGGGYMNELMSEFEPPWRVLPS